MKMKPKHLVNNLQSLDGFLDPKLNLEQYTTPPDIAASLIHHITYDIGNLDNYFVADLGCGTGTLMVGMLLVGAKFVVGIDIDRDSLVICRENLITSTSNICYDLIQIDIRDTRQIPEKLRGIFDLVIMNPPFGTKQNTQGADIDFVNAALLLVKPNGGRVYSLHKSSTRNFLERRFNRTISEDREKKDIVRAKCVAQMCWNLDQSYHFHKKQSVDIAVDLFVFERNAS